MALLRLEGEMRLGMIFAAKIAAASITVRPDEVQAAVAELVRERDAALRNLADELRGAERSHIERVRVARAARRSGRRFLSRLQEPRPNSSFRTQQHLYAEKKSGPDRAARRAAIQFDQFQLGGGSVAPFVSGGFHRAAWRGEPPPAGFIGWGSADTGVPVAAT